MKKILQYLFEHKTLTRNAAKEVLINISNGMYNESEIASFTTVFLMRSISIDELLGFRDALMELCVSVNFNGEKVLDIVGTGGDGKNTFNISTLSCFIVAGAGVKVAKHGNYGASSISGSSNVMEQLGYHFTNKSDSLHKQLDKANICFLHAPLFHPALKIVAPIRKNLGVRTFFNMLGPMVNPAIPEYQLVGVFSLEMARIYNYLLQLTNSTFTIIFTLDGYDEIFLSILKGSGSWAQNAVVLANAAMALRCTGNYSSYEECYALAVESLENGRAYECLEKLIPLQ